MDEMSPTTWYLLLLSPLFLLLLHYSLARFTASGRATKNSSPPSPPALPVIGHLHLVGALPHVSIRRLSAKYGPDLMLVRLGTASPALVASSPRAAEAILRTHDHVFASRPRSVLADIIFYGSRDVGFAKYGEDWRQARRLVTTHLLSVKKVQSLRLAREEEVRMVMAKMSKAAITGEVVDVGQILGSFTTDIICRSVSGKLSQDDRQKKLFQELVNETALLLSDFNVEYFPILARIGVIAKLMCAKAERLKKRWDELLEKLINDHENNRNFNLVCGQNEDDFVNILLSVRQESGLTREHVKAILVDVFVAGTESSAQVIEFTIAELMLRPHLLKKVQDEVRACIPGGQEIINETDMNNMTYLRAVVKEGLRLHPVTPLLGARISMASCNIDGYMIPSGMRVLVNVWAIGRDERFWEDAEEFMPERFVKSVSSAAASSVNFKGNDYQFLPFGSGRRICPGMNFAITIIELMLANLMWKFDWALSMPTMEIDMSEVFGLSVRRKEKLLLVLKQHM